MALKLPVLVRQAGLVQALAFVESRGKNSQKRLLDDLAVTVGENDKNQLLDRSREADLEEYMALTEKTLLALKWYKRFAQSILKVKPTDETKE
jgi:CRISPR-associated protein Cmr5